MPVVSTAQEVLEYLTSARHELGVSQAQLARELTEANDGIRFRQSNVAKWEGRLVRPDEYGTPDSTSLATIMRWAASLGVQIELTLLEQEEEDVT